MSVQEQAEALRRALPRRWWCAYCVGSVVVVDGRVERREVEVLSRRVSYLLPTKPKYMVLVAYQISYLRVAEESIGIGAVVG